MLDEEVHDLVGAGPDLGQADVAQHALDGEDVSVADPAHDLHGQEAGQPFQEPLRGVSGRDLLFPSSPSPWTGHPTG